MTDILQLIGAKRYQEAHEECLAMIRQNVQDPRPYHALGQIAFEHKNYAKADELLARATQLDSKSAFYWAAYAQFLSVVGNQEDARLAAEQAAGLVIEDAFTADTIGVVFSRAGFHERAVPFFKRAIELEPEPANFHYNLASSLQFEGSFQAAKEGYEAVLDRDESFFKAYSGLTTLEKQTGENNRLDKLEGLFNAHSDDANASLHLGHAIAKTYEDLGKHDESLKWLKKAKARNREQFPVSEAELRSLFEAAKESANHLHANKKNGATERGAPIFVVGLPRTGTTLVDRILSSHPDVTAAGELNVFASIVKMKAGTHNNLILDAPTLLAAARSDFGDAGERYMKGTKVLARGTPRFTDKMPLNFFYAALILQALPNARIVALRRGAMDSCISNYRQLFSTQFSYYNYTFDLERTGQFYRMFDDLMHHWRQVLPADRFREIHYEDIVFHQERETRRLLEFCDLEWNEACLRFHENEAPVSTASSVQVRQKLYSGSIGRWKRYSEGLEELQEILGDLAERSLGD